MLITGILTTIIEVTTRTIMSTRRITGMKRITKTTTSITRDGDEGR